MRTTPVGCILVASLFFCFSISSAEAKKGPVIKYAVSSSAGPNGKIKPSGTKQVRAGASKTYTATPNRGYWASIFLDGQLVATGTLSSRLSYTLSNITTPHTVRADFALPTPPPTPTPTPTPTPSPTPSATPVGATSNNISIIGFGDAPGVTSETPVIISGLAGSDIGILAVQGTNVTTGTPIPVSGKENWSAAVALVSGDNVLRFTSVAADNSQSQIETTITYYPTLDFSSALEASHTLLFTNTFTQVEFTIGIKNTAGAVVKLFETNAQGALLDAGTDMFDDGALPDEIQADGIFTVGLFPSTTVAGFHYYRVGVTRSGSTFFSEVIRVWVTSHFVNGQIDAAVNLGNTADQTFTNAINQGQTEAQAAAAAVNALKSNPNIGAAGQTPEHGVWWISRDGILGVNHRFLAEERAFASSSGSGRSASATRESQPDQESTSTIPHQIKYYTNPTNRPFYFGPNANATAAVVPDNRIRSRKAIMVSPFLNNPSDIKNSFMSGDDFNGPWNVIKNAGMNSCKLYAATAAVNNGSIAINRSTFANVSDYGYIHYCTHGDNYYNGLLSAWQDVWGPKDFLRGSLSQVILYSGEFLPKNTDGTWNISGFEEDLKQHRIALNKDAVVLLPSFFSHYLPTLPNSLVVLSFCRSTYNNSLVSAFLSHGAGAVVGYTDYVKAIYARGTVGDILTDLYLDKAVAEGVLDAVLKRGPSDGPPTPAFLTLFGAADLKLSGPELQNGSFEAGFLSNWSPEGDGRVIRRLGGTSPVEGEFMGIVSTGLGFTTNSGSIRQDLCIPANATTLTFAWNFYSEEFLTFCNSQFQDFFAVKIYELDANGQVINTTTLLNRTIDSLCGSVTPSDVSFDKGDVYNTGWLNSSFSLTAFQGKHVILEFSAGDVGDSIYDTAILIDDVKVNAPTP